jgi:hypothetical protein
MIRVLKAFCSTHHEGIKQNSILLDAFYKTLNCDTRWLGHDKRSEESYKTSVIQGDSEISLEKKTGNW